MKMALTIAGSDSGGGAGIQADLKTFQELEVFGMSALTAVTAQNTLGVHGVYPMTAEVVIEQMKAIGEDMGTDAVKTGMLFNAEIIEAVSVNLTKYHWDNVVVDPVMIAKGGASLLQMEAISAMQKFLLPLAKVVTPNIPEAEVLTGMSIRTAEDKREAAKKLHALGVQNIVLKGGHDENPSESIDLLFDGKEFYTFTSKRIPTKNTHGTGCTFSAAITAELAKGADVYQAVIKAKDFIQAAIEDGIAIGQGHGPTNHGAYRKRIMEMVQS
ncbi:bifunctional hydroxymethylpyrimidine kinase/phosphomethylpyrimidine kinase [Neobacillus rhizophilus]|uniref:Hydroxymethylpyrimidine/phosphomethylpyrimidine kinase n=1 Tax=Neobacillus rhizophilus TaxID=2833579 RepID=A0A942YSN7_9BACI|nr:bifunctional hydroxymethylpyrimidine kinase/phosphomethylpyrimidine kinase [Neobacillus rhizophilus]MBS4211334.1 bifunctional hydroxymethylpyrimidine kinase/phosphomethylpyrimidine kinase [Neobacillus rhizophilus]MBU8916752.1 bifunctional hydroxymethylpyrimidine kinase/phosphomethylpyrimidine kinase [Bacillus sp. FJAT-29953]